MFFHAAIHRPLARVVLVGYLLASTVAGLFHRHGDGCCAGGTCAAEAADESSGDSCHRHAHRICSHHAHGAPHQQPKPKPVDEYYGRPQPKPAAPFHDNCAVCRFLAQHSVAPSLVSFELWAPLVEFHAVSAPVDVSRPVVALHPARGPPHLS